MNAAGAGNYSAIRRFSTGPAPVSSGIVRPAAFVLHREAGRGARVRIRLMDAGGREAMPAVERLLGAGTHEIPVVSPAVDAWYLLDIRAGSRREILGFWP